MRQKTILQTVLLALVPYTKENAQLTFRPNQFFNELERISQHHHYQLKRAYMTGLKTGLISESESRILLTESGIQKIKPYVATRLVGNVSLMVVFDIPEQQKRKRQKFRNLLRQLAFQPVQKSVWQTELDFRDEIRAAVEELDIQPYVLTYECIKI